MINSNMFNLPIQLTEAAENYLKDIGDPNVSLTVKGGGCAGFQYVWGTTDKEPKVGNLWVDPTAEMFDPKTNISAVGSTHKFPTLGSLSVVPQTY
jgi:hypothetical protein